MQYVLQMACLVRVPTENVKQNMQMGNFSKAGQAGALRATVSGLIDQRGVAGMWRGYSTTVMREVHHHCTHQLALAQAFCVI